jgi:hypothetical protein
VIGCYLYNPGVSGMKTQERLKQFPIQTITPVGTHPIVQGIQPFQLPWDDTFPNMWISPKATVLLESDDPSFNACGRLGRTLSERTRRVPSAGAYAVWPKNIGSRNMS